MSTNPTDFESKAVVRETVWQALSDEGVARFPFPPQGRIPNFAGARASAERLLEHPLFATAKRIKVNPDSPQKYVRQMALARGIEVFVPTPRLRGGFKRLNPADIDPTDYGKASSLSKMDSFAESVPLQELPAMDVIVAGSVAVTRDGRRCGKGHGYSDLEFAILLELGRPPCPVVTTVHDLQVVGGFPTDRHDVPLSVIATPSALIDVAEPPPAPKGIDWEALPDEALDEMPVLARLKELVGSVDHAPAQ